jgi:hypothetical protein
MFDADKLPQFWLLLKNSCPNLSDEGFNSYYDNITCVKLKFCADAVMKTKYRSPQWKSYLELLFTNDTAIWSTVRRKPNSSITPSQAYAICSR